MPESRRIPYRISGLPTSPKPADRLNPYHVSLVSAVRVATFCPSMEAMASVPGSGIENGVSRLRLEG